MNRTGLILEDLWHRKILNAYWIVTLMFFAAEAVLLLLGCIPSVTAGDGPEDWLRLGIPDGCILLLMLAAQTWLRFEPKYRKQVVVGCGFLLSYLFYFIIQPIVQCLYYIRNVCRFAICSAKSFHT